MKIKLNHYNMIEEQQIREMFLEGLIGFETFKKLMNKYGYQM